MKYFRNYKRLDTPHAGNHFMYISALFGTNLISMFLRLCYSCIQLLILDIARYHSYFVRSYHTVFQVSQKLVNYFNKDGDKNINTNLKFSNFVGFHTLVFIKCIGNAQKLHDSLIQLKTF